MLQIIFILNNILLVSLFEIHISFKGPLYSNKINIIFLTNRTDYYIYVQRKNIFKLKKNRNILANIRYYLQSLLIIGPCLYMFQIIYTYTLYSYYCVNNVCLKCNVTVINNHKHQPSIKYFEWLFFSSEILLYSESQCFGSFFLLFSWDNREKLIYNILYSDETINQKIHPQQFKEH